MSACSFPAEAGNTPKGKGGTFPPRLDLEEAEAGPGHQAEAGDEHHHQEGQDQQGRGGWPGRVDAGAV